MGNRKRSPRATKGSGAARNPNLTESVTTVFQEAVLKRLNGVIFLIAESLLPAPIPDGGDTAGLKRKAKRKPLARQELLTLRLAQAGLRPIEIAELTGRHANNVSRDLSKLRKARLIR
jgi:hypothetical protein